MFKQEFIEKVSNLIKYKSIRQEVSIELNSHINELKDEYLKSEKNEEVAEQRAIDQMGNITDIADEFNKIYKPKFDWILTSITVLLLILGIIVANSLKISNIINNFNNEIFILIISLIPCAGLIIFNYKNLEKYSEKIFIGTFIITILSSYIKLISEFYTLILCLYIISYSGFIRKYGYSFKTIFMILLSLLSVIIVGKINFIILLITYIIISIFQKEFKINKKSFSILFISMSLILFGIVIYSSDYSYMKLKSYTNPNLYKNNEGYIYIKKSEILSTTKFIGESEQKIENYIGDLQDSNIITFIIAKFGILYTLLLLSLFIILVYRLIDNINSLNDNYGKNILIGISSIISIQILLNILNGLNIIPYVNIKLPFITMNKINLISDILIISICISIYRRKNLIKIDNKNIK